MVAKVYAVKQIKVNLSSGTLLIAAEGAVNSSGWKNPELAAWAYFQAPADGIQDFDFLAAPPNGWVLQVISPVAAAFRGKAPQWLKGVRVHSSSGNIVAMLGDNKYEAKIHPLASVARDDIWPWPW